MTQNNGYDCGVHVCRYAFNLVQLVDIKVKMKDVKDNFSDSISGHDLFDYDVQDIDRLRTQMYDVLTHITNLYRNHRLLSDPTGTAFDCSSGSDDEEDENEVAILTPESQTGDVSSDERSEKFSNDDASFRTQLDEEDDELSVDTTGKFYVNIRLFAVNAEFVKLCNGQFYQSSPDEASTQVSN